jgi:hypothetical protein
MDGWGQHIVFIALQGAVMANSILNSSCGILSEAVQTAHPAQYRLPEADRHAILAESDSARTDQQIKNQYTKFIAENNGDPFGQESIPET